MFTNGQKVVCINDQFPDWIKKLYTALPVEGVTYTVRGSTVGVSYGDDGRVEGEICVYVVGLINPKSNKPPFRERGFNAERFRPLEEDLETNYSEHPEEEVVTA